MLTNPWIRISFEGLLAFYPERDSTQRITEMFVGVLHQFDHFFQIAYSERPRPGGVARRPETPVPLIWSPIRGHEIRLSVHPPMQITIPDFSNLLHFDGPMYHFGTQKCEERGLTPGLAIEAGTFVSKDPHPYRRRRQTSELVTHTFGVEATIDFQAGRLGKIALDQHTLLDLDDQHDYTFYVTNTSSAETEGDEGHFRRYYHAFLDIPPNERYELHHADDAVVPKRFTYERPCLPILLTDSEPE